MSFLGSPPVIIDNGSFAIKAGFSGNDRPCALLRNVVGRPRHARVIPGGDLSGQM